MPATGAAGDIGINNAPAGMSRPMVRMAGPAPRRLAIGAAKPAPIRAPMPPQATVRPSMAGLRPRVRRANTR